MRITRTIVAVLVVVSAGGLAGVANAVGSSPFTVVNGTIQPATGTPVPPSGTHATLWRNGSSASTTVRGAGRVVIGAIGDHCEGWPVVRIRVDGTVAGEATIASATDYGAYAVGPELGDGSRTITIELVNDRYTADCDRNVHVAYARMEGSPGGTDPRFSFAVLPDTQEEVVEAADGRFRERTEWLVANRSTLDLRFVTHVGDVVKWDSADHAQYDRARAALRPLEDAGVPYSLTVGNHDTQVYAPDGTVRRPAGPLLRDTTVFNRYFTAGTVRDRFEAGKVDNAYATYEAGGVRWLVLTLEPWPRTAAVGWARDVVAAHPRHNVVVVTHHYLEADGSIGRSAAYGSTSPRYLFDNLISRYPNIRLVFSGHTGTAAYRADTGVHGNPIHSFLQTFHSRRTNPVRLVEVDTAADSLRAWIHAPHTAEDFPDHERTVTGLRLVR